jgi:hypothetical protein
MAPEMDLEFESLPPNGLYTEISMGHKDEIRVARADSVTLES